MITTIISIFVAMKGRLMLAALDWNVQNRNPIMTQEGTTKVDVVYSKKRKYFVFKQRFEKNEDQHVPILMQRIFEVQVDKRPALQCNGAPVSVDQLFAKHKTRFAK